MSNLNSLKVVLVEQNKTGKWLAGQLEKSNYTINKQRSNSIQLNLQTLDKISKLPNIDSRDFDIPTKL